MGKSGAISFSMTSVNVTACDSYPMKFSLYVFTVAYKNKVQRQDNCTGVFIFLGGCSA